MRLPRQEAVGLKLLVLTLAKQSRFEAWCTDFFFPQRIVETLFFSPLLEFEAFIPGMKRDFPIQT